MQILLAFFILGIAMQAWRTWRRNPVYSLKSTVQNLIVFLFGLAVAIAIVLMIAIRLPSQSPAAIALLCVALVTLLTLGLCGASLRITDGPPPKVASRTRPIDTYRRKLYPWILASGIVLLLLIAWVAAASALSAELALVLAALLVGISVPALGGLYIKARRTDYGIAALKSNFWVHWQYAIGQGETWLGPDGLLNKGEYTPWLTSGNYLTKASVDPGPPSYLVLTFEKVYGAYSGPVTTRVTIPDGRQSDLELLEAKLRTRCSKAHVDLRRPLQDGRLAS